ncbi:hypothetical protein GY45DRAFT_986968 [Cubamyces sp. BRFM 1775]|nr:hypothetical protein GY45DRAFT_986968 [Cubamyces sp. BRFM 1775]
MGLRVFLPPLHSQQPGSTLHHLTAASLHPHRTMFHHTSTCMPAHPTPYCHHRLNNPHAVRPSVIVYYIPPHCRIATSTHLRLDRR